MMRRIPFEIAHYMALIPLACLLVMHVRGKKRDAAYWWLAAAFSVSWVADLAAEMLPPTYRWIVSFAYPVLQTAMIGAVLLTRRDANIVAGALCCAALAAVYWRGVSKPDVLVHTLAWLMVVGIVADRWALGNIRAALLVYFGLGWVSWIGYVASPGWWPWLALQASRLVGLLLICRAFASPRPGLQVVPP